MRALSAMALMPVAVIGVLWGLAAFSVLTFALCAVMLFEWARMSAPSAARSATLVFSVGAAGGILSAASGFLALAAVIVAGTSAAAWLWIRSRGEGAPGLAAAGAGYIAFACCTIVWIRGQAEGELIVLTLMAAVWAADTGAYIVGTLAGGPRFLPRFSPNKTWAGVGGGMAAAAATAYVAALFWFPALAPAGLAAIGAAAAFAAQLGDAFESAMKRRFGVKDSGKLIPGHGGALDRLDGLILATLALAPIIHVYVSPG